MGSNAVSSAAVAAVTGYLLEKGYFNSSSPNLPQNISIFGQANTANQSGLSTDPVQITSAKQAATLYGYGSPIHAVARILFPNSGANVSIPVYVYPQAAASGAVAKVITVTPTGTATANGTIYLNICGRTNLDGGSYAINVETGDDETDICDKMRTAVAAVLGCPILGSGTTTFIATAKFKGLESNDLKISVDLNGTSLGVTFAVVSTTSGSGTAAVTTSLNKFDNKWNTIVINTYGLVSDTMAEFEAFNGIPDPTVPTGRYAGTIWRPMFAFSGTVADDPTSVTSAGQRPNNVTIVPCVAPLSQGMPYEAAANAAYVWATIAQDRPHNNVLNIAYPDMPAPATGSVPQMNAYTFRQYCVTHGCSTVDLVNNTYIMKDFVTTYNAEGEFPPFYRYVRDLNIHWNIKFKYHVLEEQKLVGKTLVRDAATVTVPNCVKPKMWKADVSTLIDELERTAFIADAGFSKNGLTASINSTNPKRIDTEFPVQITGTAEISATTVKGGFYTGN
jgi:phage tail sheath gpL-like